MLLVLFKQPPTCSDEILEQPVYELGEDGEELQDEPPIDLVRSS